MRMLAKLCSGVWSAGAGRVRRRIAGQVACALPMGERCRYRNEEIRMVADPFMGRSCENARLARMLRDKLVTRECTASGQTTARAGIRQWSPVDGMHGGAHG